MSSGSTRAFSAESRGRQDPCLAPDPVIRRVGTLMVRNVNVAYPWGAALWTNARSRCAHPPTLYGRSTLDPKVEEASHRSPEVGSPNMQPLVSVIVLNFNGSEHLPACLTSLKEQTYSPMEILVADNGSTDESESVVAAAAVRWEPLGRNHGFGPGYNLAVDLCGGEILVFANMDTRFAPTFVERVIAPLREKDDVFTSEGAMYNWYDQTDVRMAQSIHRISLWKSLLGASWLPMLDRRSDLITDVADATEVSGAGMALHRVKFDELGRFDARLPFGWETTEICWRAWLRGWRSVCVPDAQVFHRQEQLLGSMRRPTSFFVAGRRSPPVRYEAPTGSDRTCDVDADHRGFGGTSRCPEAPSDRGLRSVGSRPGPRAEGPVWPPLADPPALRTHASGGDVASSRPYILGPRCGPGYRIATASRCPLDIVLRRAASEFVSREDVGLLGRQEQDGSEARTRPLAAPVTRTSYRSVTSDRRFRTISKHL